MKAMIETTRAKVTLEKIRNAMAVIETELRRIDGAENEDAAGEAVKLIRVQQEKIATLAGDIDTWL